MSVKERDPLTGHQTTGHEWNGITELNTRVPRAIWFFIAITHIWALFYWVLMPAWPLVNTYTKGLLGQDQQKQVEARLSETNSERGEWADQIAALPIDEIRANDGLMRHVSQTAPALFGNNCAACHGSKAKGGPGYPSLVDDAWLWGGDDETILETIRVGINAPHPESRYAEMLAFGRDGMLERDEIRTVVNYVQSLSGLDTSLSEAAEDEGATIFADNCASCHGENATGSQDLGAPNLTDDFWIYGSDDATMFETVFNGRRGWMPAWADRLTPADRKILTIYLSSLKKETEHAD